MPSFAQEDKNGPTNPSSPHVLSLIGTTLLRSGQRDHVSERQSKPSQSHVCAAVPPVRSSELPAQKYEDKDGSSPLRDVIKGFKLASKSFPCGNKHFHSFQAQQQELLNLGCDIEVQMLQLQRHMTNQTNGEASNGLAKEMVRLIELFTTYKDRSGTLGEAIDREYNKSIRSRNCRVAHV